MRTTSRTINDRLHRDRLTNRNGVVLHTSWLNVNSLTHNEKTNYGGKRGSNVPRNRPSTSTDKRRRIRARPSQLLRACEALALTTRIGAGAKSTYLLIGPVARTPDRRLVVKVRPVADLTSFANTLTFFPRRRPHTCNSNHDGWSLGRSSRPHFTASGAVARGAMSGGPHHCRRRDRGRLRIDGAWWPHQPAAR